MRVVFGLVLVVGMALAGFAIYMVNNYLAENRARLAEAEALRSQIVKTVGVYVANRSLRYGEKLTPEDVHQVRWPVDALPEGVFKAPEELFPKGPDVPRRVVRAMEKNEPIMVIKVTEPGQDAGVASRLAKGMRAFAIRVDVASGVSGFLRPGDRVDIYWTANGGLGLEGSGGVTKLIESGVKLLAVDQIADADTSSATIARTVTVEATPLQVAALAQAQASGRLSLALLGAEDTTTSSNVEYDSRDLLGIVEQKVVKAEPEKVCTVKTRRGAEIIETPIECPPSN